MIFNFKGDAVKVDESLFQNLDDLDLDDEEDEDDPDFDPLNNLSDDSAWKLFSVEKDIRYL